MFFPMGSLEAMHKLIFTIPSAIQVSLIGSILLKFIEGKLYYCDFMNGF